MAEVEPTVQILVSCQIQGCAEETSYHLDMVRMTPSGPVCQECFEEGDHNFQKYDEDKDEFLPDWHDLPPVTIEMCRA